MQQKFLGYHSEWNMGSPGGWDYQRMAQEIGRIAWKAIKEKAGLDIELDFDDPILNPVPNFADLLLRAHKIRYPEKAPYIALVAEKETLSKVGENIRFVEFLNKMPGVKAVLAEPSQLRLKDGEIYLNGNKLTTIFIDFNNNVIIKLRKKYGIEALLAAIKKGIVVNPRGMEPLGAKGVFEGITSEYKDILSPTTVRRTPWTRQFYRRKTTGPHDERINDLVRWTEENWKDVILKPVHGYSGQGIIIGKKEKDKKKSIHYALKAGDYIVQQFVPLENWTEEFPWIDREKKRLFLKKWQTDFRCFITDKGLIGFVTRFGGIPTNVGAGGGIQSTAILRSEIELRKAKDIINSSILKLGFKAMLRLQNELDQKSLEIGSVYLLGPIKCTLRPRIITTEQVDSIQKYASNLWDDALLLEQLWLEGKLKKYVQISEEEDEIARLAPWRGGPALMASDGLFGFR